VAAGMIVWAIVQSNIAHRPVGVGAVAGANLLQGFDPAAIGSIVLKAGGRTVTLLRKDGGFVVVEKSNYPAKTKQINYLISSCLDIQTAELITSDRANFAELGLSDDKPEKAIQFFRPDKSMITGILVGKTAKDMSGTYVRLVSSDKAYLSTNLSLLHTETMDYIERLLISVNRDDIKKVSVTARDGSYVITNEPGRGIVLSDLPAGKQGKSNEVTQVFGAFTNMMINDVAKDSGNVKTDRTVTCELKDSTVYTVHLTSKGNKTQARYSAEFMDQSAVMKRAGVESQEELKAKEAKLLARDRAGEFAKRTRGWVYELDDRIAVILATKLADMIEDEPKKSSEPGKTAPYDPTKTMPHVPKKSSP
jgi:hypothetical protein